MSVLYRGGRIYAPGNPPPTAVLVDAGRIAWLGQSENAPDADRTVDVAGAWIAPAFVDGSLHLLGTGLAGDELDLTGVPSLTAVLDRVAQAGRAARGGAVVGRGWLADAWPEGRRPSAGELDRASYGGVVLLVSAGGDRAVASSALLAAVPEARQLPGWGADGFVSGPSFRAVERAVREARGPARCRAAARAAMAAAAAAGVVAVHALDELDEPDERDELDEPHRSEMTPTPSTESGTPLPGSHDAEPVTVFRYAQTLSVDGPLGPGTAPGTESGAVRRVGAFGDGDAAGELFCDEGDVADLLVAASCAGTRSRIRAHSARAVEVAVRGIGAAAAVVGLDRLRTGVLIDGITLVSQNEVASLAALGMPVCLRPAGIAAAPADTSGGGGTEGSPGYAEAVRALVTAGVPVMLGTGSPDGPLDMWAALRTVTGAVPAGAGAPGMSPRAAITAATRAGWRAAGHPDAGVLAVGAPAHLAIWDIPPEDSPSARGGGPQAPVRGANWSTDPRSAVPAVLGLHGGAPALLATVHAGRTTFTTGPARAWRGC